MDRYFINLTNGIEFYPDIADLSNFAGYVRIVTGKQIGRAHV